MKRKTLRAALIGTTALTALAVITPANADDRFGSIDTWFFNAISPNGEWAAGGTTSSIFFPLPSPTLFNLNTAAIPRYAAGINGVAYGVDNSGGMVGGYYPSSLIETAFYLDSSGVLHPLQSGLQGIAYAVNGDGTFAVGSQVDSNGEQHAGWWTIATGHFTVLGNFPGQLTAAAYGLSDDGTVIAGQIHDTNNNNTAEYAVVWQNGHGHFLTQNDFGSALAVSGDGTTVVGWSGVDESSAVATRWTLVPGNGATNPASTVSLGTLNPGEQSQATAVNHDGSVVVGWSGTSAPSPTGVSNSAAFRWTSADQMQSIQSLVADLGISMTGWTLSTATGVSADGRRIVGYGQLNGTLQGWIARLALPGDTTGGGGNNPPPPPSGLIGLDVLGESLAGQSAIGQMGNGIIGGDLSAFNQYALQDHASHGNTPWSVFGYASYNSDPAGAGTIGITRDLPGSMIIGAAVSGDYATTNMVFNGSATMQGGSGGAFLARIPDSGLQWFLGIDGTSLSGSVRRGYLNGSGPASSQGNTDVDGYGATARIGWTFQSPVGDTRFTPFVSYTYTSAHVDGYAESGGPFPMQLDGFDSDQQTARVGADARYTFAPGQWLWGSAAWAHLVNGGNGPTISGQLIGLFGVSAPGITGAPDWAELTAGIRLPAWSNGAVTASVTASVPTDDEPVTYVARLGVSQAF